MAGMALPSAVVGSSGRVAPPQDCQAQVPPGSKLCLIASSTWSQGSGHHSKTSVPRQLPFIHTHNPGIWGVGGRSANVKKKREVTFKGLHWASVDPGQNLRWYKTNCPSFLA